MNLTIFTLLLSMGILVFGGNMMAETVATADEAGTVLYMNSLNNSLTVLESPDAKMKKVGKVFYNSKDYTAFVKEILNTQSLTFASGKLLIFGSGEVISKGGEWICNQGTIFVPGETEILFIKSSEIKYHDKTQVLTGKNSVIKKVPVTGNEKIETKELKEMTLDLSNWK